MEVLIFYFLDFINFLIYFLVRKDIIEKYGDKWVIDLKIYIGNGFFKMIKWVYNLYIEFVKNFNYWDVKLIIFEKIVFKFLEDVNVNFFVYEVR